MAPNSAAAEYELRAPADVPTDEVLTPGALAFLVALQREFGRARRDLLAARNERQAELDFGDARLRAELPGYP